MTSPGASPAAPRHHVILATFAGGMLGTGGRALVGEVVPHGAGGWPWPTLIVNLVGALLIGWLSVWLPRSTDIDPRLHPFLVTGVCGGLTTFSALQLDTLTLSTPALIAYFAVSVAGGLLMVLAGQQAAHAAHQGDGA